MSHERRAPGKEKLNETESFAFDFEDVSQGVA